MLLQRIRKRSCGMRGEKFLIKMESLVMNRLIPQTMTAVSVLALALAVGGCGSSSDDDGMPMMPEPTPEDNLAQMKMECEDMGGRYNADDDPPSCTDAAALAKEERMAGIIEGRRLQCLETDGNRWNDDNTCSSAADVLAEDEMACTDDGGRWNDNDTCTDSAELMVEAKTAAAGTKAMAIAAEAAQVVTDSPTVDPTVDMHEDAGLGGTDTTDGSAVATYDLTISRDRDGTEIEITDTALAGDDDPKFTQEMDLGGGTTMHVRKMKADEDTGDVMDEVVIVTTDIEAPEATPFAMEHALTVDEDGEIAADDDAVAFDPGVELTSEDAANAVILAHIMSDAFAAASGESVVHTFNAAVEDDTPTDGVDQSVDAAEVDGTYNGAPGTYKCIGATDCDVTVDNEGMLTAASDGWIFIPNAGAMVDMQDGDYLHYGFWLARTNDSDGNVKVYDEVETFAGSSVTATGNVADVEGMATYEGGATGVYVNNVFNSDGTLDEATSGHFTAEAMLTAYFGGDDVAVSMKNTVEGTIDSFMLSGDEEADMWSVDLEGTITPVDGTASGTANGGGTDEGSFRATFHGPSEVDVDGTATATQPHSVVGEFNSYFANGSVAGAFGARMPEEDE